MLAWRPSLPRSVARTVLPTALTRALAESGRLASATAAPLTAALPAWPLPVAITVEIAAAAAGLADGEVRLLPLRSLAFRTRQGGPDQSAVNGPVVVEIGSRERCFLIGGRRIKFCNFDRIGRRFELWLWPWLGLRLGLRNDVDVERLLFERPRPQQALTRVGRRRRIEFLPAGSGHFRLLVLVIRIARRAARVLHLIANDRDNGVVRNAALARTVVVENVTEPKPALRHRLVCPSRIAAGPWVP